MAEGTGQNGYITNFTDPSFPAQEVGEEVFVADLVGQRDDANSRRVWFKAFAGATGSGKTQLAAQGIAPRHMPKGARDGFRKVTRIALPTPLPSALSGIKPGDKLYLSATTPGALTKTAPSTTGQLVQVIGECFWEGDRITGINANETANAAFIDIQPATVVS